MSATIPGEISDSLEKTLGVQEARKLVEALNASLLFMDQKIEDSLEKIKDKADFYITQKKFELKDELTRELATKEDLVRLEGGFAAEFARLEGSFTTEFARLEGVVQTVRQEMQTMRVELDRKFTLMFAVLLFSIVFLNQNALEFLAKLFGLIH